MTAAADHILWMLILSVLFAGVAIALSYISRWEAVVASLAALLLGKFSGYIALGTSSMWFWVGAVLIVLGINYLLPVNVRNSRTGMPFFTTGALVGAFVGMLLNSEAGIITACAIGVLLAAVAFSRMRAGAALGFPSRKFFNYLCAKGLPLVVIFSMLGILSLQLIVNEAAL